MKIRVRKALLESVLSNTGAFLEKKDASQITSHIFLQAFDNTLTIKATDYEIGLSAKLADINVDEEGKATANGKKLIDIIRILKDDEIILETLEDTLVIKQKKSQYKLPMFNANEYPNFPSTENLPKIEINGLKLMNAFKKVSSSIDTNNPKFELGGALIDVGEFAVNIVGTDTKRLALFKIDNAGHTADTTLIIPKKATLEMQKLFFDDIALYTDQTHLIVRSGHVLFFTKLINGKYPDYKRILPKDFTYNFTLPKDKMVEAIRQIIVVSGEIKMTLKPEGISFESLSDETSQAVTEIEIELAIPTELTLAVNSRYILDFLSSIDTKEFSISLNEPEKPFQLKSDDFITIVMPIIL